MSYRIHRHMGWGMKASEYELLAKVPLDELWDVMHECRELVMPKDAADGEFIICRDLLMVKPLTDSDERLTSAVDLFDDLCSPDETYAVVFYPNAYYARKWSKRDDDLDYAFEQWRSFNDGEGTTCRHAVRGMQNAPRDFITFLPYNPYPFTNNLMLADGAKKDWELYWEVEKHPEWLPAVPHEIRWYLQHLGIMDKAATLRLRPLIAQVWL